MLQPAAVFLNTIKTPALAFTKRAPQGHQHLHTNTITTEDGGLVNEAGWAGFNLLPHG